MPDSRTPTTLQRLTTLFREAMADLRKSPTEGELEEWAVLIHASMSGRGRSYHTVEHVFQVAGEGDGIAGLAILFHDTIDWELDSGFPTEVLTVIGDTIDIHADEGAAELSAFDARSDRLRALVCMIHGHDGTESARFSHGSNEVVSSFLAVRSLYDHLSLRQLAEVVTCIEATVPFREEGAEEELAERLSKADATFSLGLGEEGVETALHRAVMVANRDVANFSFEDTGRFLSHTWEILPEANPNLRRPAYTLGEYRTALAGMEVFLKGLDVRRVFRSFRSVPSKDILQELRQRGGANLDRGVRYLREKLLAARLIESLAEISGGDAPVSLFMGDWPGVSQAMRFEDLLPAPAGEPKADTDAVVLNLLAEGRDRESAFDLRHSPLSTYLYHQLGDEESDRLLAIEDAETLLITMPEPLVREVTEACIAMAPTRSTSLRALLERRALADAGG